MATRRSHAAPRRGALMSWIRGTARAQGSPRSHDFTDFAVGDEVVPDGPSPLDSLPHGDLLATLERELGRLRLENSRLRADLETRTIAYRTAHENEDRYRAAFHGAPIALVETDVVGTVTRCNRAAAELVGCGEADLTGKPLHQLAGSPAAREKLREISIAHGRVESTPPHKPIPLELRRSDGETIGVELFHATKTDERGRAVGSLLAIADIAERARREAEVQASANAYRDLFDGAPVMLLAIDAKNTTILECNTAVAQATGYSRTELLDRSIFDLYDPACLDHAAESFRKFLHEGRSRDVQLRVRTKTGGTFSVLESSTAVADETGAILACRMTWRRVEVQAREPLRASPTRRAS